MTDWPVSPVTPTTATRTLDSDVENMAIVIVNGVMMEQGLMKVYVQLFICYVLRLLSKGAEILNNRCGIAELTWGTSTIKAKYCHGGERSVSLIYKVLSMLTRNLQE